MFNVEGKIPDPFDQGMLDCFSQARPSTQRIQLLGTIVMNDENFSVALLQEDGNPTKIGVKKDDVFFDGKFQALKIERKRFCFQVRSSQDFEYIDIPDNDLAGPSLTTNLSASEGITPVSENQFLVDQNFLEKNLLNLNEILQTARAVPYLEPGTGKFKGFLVQSIENTSPFAKLGVKQGDILTGVNDVVFDNAGKSLEAFQKFRNSPKISLEIIRGGQKTTKVYDVKN
jgi:general secretion pathway protein C